MLAVVWVQPAPWVVSGEEERPSVGARLCANTGLFRTALSLSHVQGDPQTALGSLAFSVGKPVMVNGPLHFTLTLRWLWARRKGASRPAPTARSPVLPAARAASGSQMLDLGTEDPSSSPTTQGVAWAKSWAFVPVYTGYLLSLGDKGHHSYLPTQVRKGHRVQPLWV